MVRRHVMRRQPGTALLAVGLLTAIAGLACTEPPRPGSVAPTAITRPAPPEVMPTGLYVSGCFVFPDAGWVEATVRTVVGAGWTVVSTPEADVVASVPLPNYRATEDSWRHRGILVVRAVGQWKIAESGSRDCTAASKAKAELVDCIRVFPAATASPVEWMHVIPLIDGLFADPGVGMSTDVDASGDEVTVIPVRRRIELDLYEQDLWEKRAVFFGTITGKYQYGQIVSRRGRDAGGRAMP